jgi:hypothetical protein
LGEILVGLGYIRQDALKDLVRRQIREAISDLFLWREGQFEYQDCEVDIDQRGIGETNIMELIIEGVKRMDEAGDRQEEHAIAS